MYGHILVMLMSSLIMIYVLASYSGPSLIHLDLKYPAARIIRDC